VSQHWASALLAVGVGTWAVIFAAQAVTRHLALGTHAEDLGFTDQVIWNMLRGRWFEMTLYQGASWNTEIPIGDIRSPGSLNAFHVEPMLALLTPIYALGGGPRELLTLQAAAFALGAVPAYRLALRLTGLRLAGLAVAAVWLLSPLGQWAILSDFHTTALAAPLIVLAAERFAAGRPAIAILAGLLAASAREDAAIAVAGLGVAVALTGRWRSGSVLAGLAAFWAVASLTIMREHSGGVASPFALRYSSLLGGPPAALEALLQPHVRGYLGLTALSGGWLALLSPLSLAPAAPLLALNVFSSSPWMASGRAHYSVLVLPFLVIACASGLGLIQRLGMRGQLRWLRSVTPIAAATLIGTSMTAYASDGAGPLARGHAPAQVTQHAILAREIASSISPIAAVSASAALYPHVSQRARAYVFPALEDADHVLIDVNASPAPTSAGDVYLRVRSMLESGAWSVGVARDGILLLNRERAPGCPELEHRSRTTGGTGVSACPRGSSEQARTGTGRDACSTGSTPELWTQAVDCLPEEFFSFTRPAGGNIDGPDRPGYVGGNLEVLSGELLPSPTATVEPDGPQGILRTLWRTGSPPADWARPSVQIALSDGATQHVDEIATLWWYPPSRWPPGEIVQVDIPRVPLRRFAGWTAQLSRPQPARVPLGDLTLEVDAEPWRMRLLGPTGAPLWEEAADGAVGFQTADGVWRRARMLRSIEPLADGGTRLVATTDDPGARDIVIDARSVNSRSARLSIAPLGDEPVQRVGGSLLTPADEHFVGFGERFTGVNQRGTRLEVWADDRILAGHGESTYAPIPLLLSSRGHSMLLERSERAWFDLAASQPDRWSWEQESDRVDLVVSYGEDLKSLVRQHAAVTGLPPRPPIWAFGVIKTSTGGQDHVLAEMQRIREMGVPVSAVYAYDSVDYAANIGWPYVNYAGRTVGPYPDHADFTARLHALGFKALTYFKADFHLDRPGWQVPAERGFLVRGPAGELLQHQRFPVTWLDFTNVGAVDWWRSLWQRAIGELGYDGGMLDVGEILPADAVMADGSSGQQAHNRYPLLYAQYAWEHASAIRPDGDFLLFARSGAAGAQKYQSLQWPGDPTMRWEAPDGLRSLVPAALSFGLSGFPYWHPEVAGYVQVGLPREQERELWLRWLQLGAWSSTLRDQYGDYAQGPMDFWLDETNQTAFRDAARIHNSLVPYIYSAVAEAAHTGLPLMRYLPLEVPHDPRAWQQEDSYFFGPNILVAPVLEPGATARTVYLPPGTWADYWTDQVYQGGQEVTVSAPLDGGRAPAFIRGGAIVPLAPEFDTLAPSSVAGVETYAHDLIVRVAPGGTGSSEFTLYDGTTLIWNGVSLVVTGNAVPRSITLRAPGQAELTARLDGASMEIGR
jgi:alpha-D-xyloside xylohydrolase